MHRHRVAMIDREDRPGSPLFLHFLVALLWVLTLALPIPAWAEASGPALMERFFQTVHTIQARFSQKITDRSGQVVRRAQGEVWIERPGRFRWVYAGENGQTIVSNGQDVWLYDPALEQVTVQPLGKALGSTPAALIAGRNVLESRFRIVDAGMQDGLYWVRLTPKGNQAEGFTGLRLGFDAQGVLKRMVMEDAFQQTTALSFLDVRVNQAIPARQFTFTPPKGVDVLRQ